MSASLMTDPAHVAWLGAETERLIDFARGSKSPGGGFAWLDDAGHIDPSHNRELYENCRMIHVFAIGSLLGLPGCDALVDHGIRGIRMLFEDTANGGWYPEVLWTGKGIGNKVAYAHAFVILAGSSAAIAGHPGGRELLEQALNVSEKYFWDEKYGMVREEWDPSFTVCDDYRGVNANMHTVEAYLAAADATGDRLWLDRAVRMIQRVVHGFAQGNGWRIPEHFNAAWAPDMEFNADHKADQFRPYGATIGHSFEWARLTLHARAALGDVAPSWMATDAAALFAQGVHDGWAVDGADGFVYTVGWDGRPVVHERMHWVAAEAIGAAAALFKVTGDPAYDEYYRRWWEYIQANFIDTELGSWRHELDRENRPSAKVWPGKPDAYHAAQATLIPRLPLAPTITPAIAHGLLDNAS